MPWEAGSPVLSGLMIQHTWSGVTEYSLTMPIPSIPNSFVYNDWFLPYSKWRSLKKRQYPCRGTLVVMMNIAIKVIWLGLSAYWGFEIIIHHLINAYPGPRFNQVMSRWLSLTDLPRCIGFCSVCYVSGYLFSFVESMKCLMCLYKQFNAWKYVLN